MSSDNFYEVVRKVAEQQRIMEDSFAATIKQLENSPVVRLQRELENSAAVRLQKALENSPVTAFEKQAEEAAAKLRGYELVAAHAAERLRAFDSVAAQAAKRFRAACETSTALQAIAKAEESFAATVAAQRYLDEQVAQWERLRNSLVHEQTLVISPSPASHTIKARIPKIRISAQAKQEYIPAPAEPTVSMPSAAHWLASALEAILTKGAFKRTVEPHVVDMCDEYQDAIRSGRKGKATWAIVRGHLLIVGTQVNRVTVALSSWLAVLKGWLGLWG